MISKLFNILTKRLFDLLKIFVRDFKLRNGLMKIIIFLKLFALWCLKNPSSRFSNYLFLFLNLVPPLQTAFVYLLRMKILHSHSNQQIECHCNLDHSDPRIHQRWHDSHFRLPWLNTKVYRQDPLKLYTDSMFGRSIWMERCRVWHRGIFSQLLYIHLNCFGKIVLSCIQFYW